VGARRTTLGIELTLDIFNRVHLDGDFGTRFWSMSVVPGVVQFCHGHSFYMSGWR